MSTTPPGSPSPNSLAFLQPAGQPAPTTTTPAAIPSVLLEQLANIVRVSAAASAPAPSVTPAVAPSPVQVAPQLPPVTSSTQPVFSASGQPSNGAMPSGYLPSVGYPGMPYMAASQPAGQSVNLPPPMPYGFPAPAAHVQPAQVPGAAPGSNTASTVQLFNALLAQGMSIDQIASVMRLMGQPSGTAPTASAGDNSTQLNSTLGPSDRRSTPICWVCGSCPCWRCISTLRLWCNFTGDEQTSELNPSHQ